VNSFKINCAQRATINNRRAEVEITRLRFSSRPRRRSNLFKFECKLFMPRGSIITSSLSLSLIRLRYLFHRPCPPCRETNKFHSSSDLVLHEPAIIRRVNIAETVHIFIYRSIHIYIYGCIVPIVAIIDIVRQRRESGSRRLETPLAIIARWAS